MNNPTLTTQNLSSPSLPDFTIIADKLQETAQALLEFSRADQVSDHDEAEDEKAPPESASKNADKLFEVRSYQLPYYILRDEQELLEITESDELVDVLNKAYDHFYCIANLMKHFDQEEDVCGVDLNNIAQVLSLPLDWLERLSSTLSGFELVHHMKTE